MQYALLSRMFQSMDGEKYTSNAGGKMTIKTTKQPDIIDEHDTLTVLISNEDGSFWIRRAISPDKARQIVAIILDEKERL